MPTNGQPCQGGKTGRLGIVREDAIGQGVDTTAYRPRLEEVAARVGLAPSTVSLVLRNIPGPSGETRRRVLRAAEELGYRPNLFARSLRSKIWSIRARR